MKKLGRPPLPPEQRGIALWVPLEILESIKKIIREYRENILK